MELINRGFIAVNPKREFMQKINDLLELDIPTPAKPESSIYLIEEDFINDQTTLNKHIKEIIESELQQLDPENKSEKPEINSSNFREYFEVSMGSFVYDLHHQT